MMKQEWLTYKVGKWQVTSDGWLMIVEDYAKQYIGDGHNEWTGNPRLNQPVCLGTRVSNPHIGWLKNCFQNPAQLCLFIDIWYI